ncbi:phosphatidylinositol 4-kinase gamma 7-like [Silene latifolia]|uniref:phosphatidylinositol 4-kinase gamma 7-like n=1 Tax=Silene latifolia TaxID=37657 RepID=UPI003D77D7FF
MIEIFFGFLCSIVFDVRERRLGSLLTSPRLSVARQADPTIMSKVGSPVQTRSPMGVFKNLLSGKFHGKPRQPTGRRRVFVQTDTGCVLGMELDRSDNVHTVKRRLQVELNFPTDESLLSFGDMVLENDLDAVRNDSPLLLSRTNMHRSSSTPCLSPRGSDHEPSDKSSVIEVLGNLESFVGVKEMVKEIDKGIKNGVDPLLVHSGLGGAYYFRNSWGENVAIVKPTDEEPFAPNNPKGFVGRALGHPGLKQSVRVGETGIREVVAYLLDHEQFAGVPPTALVKITHSVFNVNDGVNGNKPHKKKLASKIASCQQFIPHDFDASDHGTSSFPVSSVHKIGILDVRIFNTDRHAGNLLIRKLDGIGRFGQVELIPIDHGLCLPESLEDPYFEWIHWPQASLPFSVDELDYIQRLDPYMDCEMLRAELPMIREASLRILVLCTVFLKEAARFGLCLAEIGEMMSREFRSGEEEPSELELLCIEARRLVSERELLVPNTEATDDEFLFDVVSCDEHEYQRGPFSKLASLEEEKEESDDGVVEKSKGKGFTFRPIFENFPSMTRISQSLKNTSLSEKNLKFSGTMTTGTGYSSSGNKSANEQLPASANFVKVADMNKEEWSCFLEKFQELLRPAFAQRKSDTIGQRQRQRLGTSCKF